MLHCHVLVAAAAFVRNEDPPEQNDAHWLLDFYSSFMSCSPQDTTDRALECLAKVGWGGHAFCTAWLLSIFALQVVHWFLMTCQGGVGARLLYCQVGM
jgi:hypothetical protein